MAQCVISSLCSLQARSRPPVNAVACRTLRPIDEQPDSRTTTGRACRSSRHAVSPICTRPTSTCSFGPSRTEHRKTLTRLRSLHNPQKTPIPPPTPNDVSLERPRNASGWIGSECHGIFPRSYSGHYPSNCAPPPPAYSYVHAVLTVCTWPAGQPELKTLNYTPTLGNRFRRVRVKWPNCCL